MSHRLTWLLLAAVLAGCGARQISAGPREAVTLTNLHPDETRGRMYSVNYQQRGLIPICTPVRIESVTSEKAVITVLTTGRRYDYYFHRSLRDPVERHLGLYFGPACDRARIAALGPADREGIRDGEVYEGMTKQGVVYALGYPPPHATPTLDHDVWTYWDSRFDKIQVIFENGYVRYLRE